MVLSELTNKELKGILRENDVINYSKDDLLNSINYLENIDENVDENTSNTSNISIKDKIIKNIFKITL